MDINTQLVPKSIDNAVQNITDKPTQAMGATFSDIWYLVFGGVSFAADKKRLKYSVALEQYEAELKAATENIPEEKIVDPSIQVTAQALEASKYCITSDALREMFVNLISGTMNSDYEKNVHPSFPEILKQLDERDAKFLKAISTKESIPIVDIGVKNKSKGYFLISSKVVLPYDGLSSSECTLSAAALERAGILSISTGNEHLTNDNLYEEFKSLPDYQAAKNISEHMGTKVHLSKGVCRLTNLGKAFVSVCVR